MEGQGETWSTSQQAHGREDFARHARPSQGAHSQMKGNLETPICLPKCILDCGRKVGYLEGIHMIRGMAHKDTESGAGAKRGSYWTPQVCGWGANHRTSALPANRPV